MSETLIEETIEELAALEHDQWIEWSKSLVANEPLLKDDRVRRWQALWIPYSELSEESKEQDRVWARKSCERLVPKIELNLLEEISKEIKTLIKSEATPVHVSAFWYNEAIEDISEFLERKKTERTK